MSLGIMVAIVIIIQGLILVGLSISFAVKPTEVKLGLIRPLSISTTFASVLGVVCGLAVTFRNISNSMQHQSAENFPLTMGMGGLGEALIPAIIGFSFLTMTWIAVSLGMRKHI